VASVVPMGYDDIADNLPLAIGLQLRNIALSQANVRIIPPGRAANAAANEILGDYAEEWG
jgi:hypothetical protein